MSTELKLKLKESTLTNPSPLDESVEFDKFIDSLEDEGTYGEIREYEELDKAPTIDGEDQVRLLKVTNSEGTVWYFVVKGFYWEVELETQDKDEAFNEFEGWTTDGELEESESSEGHRVDSKNGIYEVGDRVAQRWTDEFNVGTVVDVKEEDGVQYKVEWDYSDGPDVEWLYGDDLSRWVEESLTEDVEEVPPYNKEVASRLKHIAGTANDIADYYDLDGILSDSIKSLNDLKEYIERTVEFLEGKVKTEAKISRGATILSKSGNTAVVDDFQGKNPDRVVIFVVDNEDGITLPNGKHLNKGDKIECPVGKVMNYLKSGTLKEL